MEINSLKINSLETKVENLEIDMEYVTTVTTWAQTANILKFLSKIMEMTDNIKLKIINENRLQSDFYISNINFITGVKKSLYDDSRFK